MLRSSLLAIAALLLSTQLQAKTCELSIDSTDQMTFSAKELSVGADCTEVKLTLHHVGKLAKNVMGHNWVLTKTADYQPVAQDGMKAGLDADYLKADDDRIIAHTA
ncbi:MAG: azurin, partial [Xanthomonadaceae bacterium]|nr:azurin [Xanthomonadaceae bacterium]